MIWTLKALQARVKNTQCLKNTKQTFLVQKVSYSREVRKIAGNLENGKEFRSPWIICKWVENEGFKDAIICVNHFWCYNKEYFTINIKYREIKKESFANFPSKKYCKCLLYIFPGYCVFTCPFILFNVLRHFHYKLAYPISSLF